MRSKLQASSRETNKKVLLERLYYAQIKVSSKICWLAEATNLSAMKSLPAALTVEKHPSADYLTYDWFKDLSETKTHSGQGKIKFWGPNREDCIDFGMRAAKASRTYLNVFKIELQTVTHFKHLEQGRQTHFTQWATYRPVLLSAGETSETSLSVTIKFNCTFNPRDI